MTGKTHKFLGAAAGSALMYYGMVMFNERLYALAVVPAVFGAMIPDIDHDKSKIGSSRKKITAIFSVLFAISIVIGVGAFLTVGYFKGALWTSLITVFLVLLPFGVLSALSKIEVIRSNLKFLTKHRGIMHTLILPSFMVFALFAIGNPQGSFEVIFSIMLQGLIIGYLSHLFADVLTTRGCPLLYPLSKSNISIFGIKTGSKAEYIAAFATTAGMATLVFFLTR